MLAVVVLAPLIDKICIPAFNLPDMPAVPTSLILIEGDRARLILGLSAAFVSGFLGKDKNTRRQHPHAARHFARAIRRGDCTSKPEGNATAGAWEWVKINEKIS